MSLPSDFIGIYKLCPRDFYPANGPIRRLQVYPVVRILIDGISDQRSAKSSGSGKAGNGETDNRCGQQAFHAELDATYTFAAASPRYCEACSQSSPEACRVLHASLGESQCQVCPWFNLSGMCPVWYPSPLPLPCCKFLKT